MDLNKLVASRIRGFRENHNISQKALAKRFGISVSAYSRLESGDVQITLDTLERISRELSVPIINILNQSNSEVIKQTDGQFTQRGNFNFLIDGENLEKLTALIKSKIN